MLTAHATVYSCRSDCSKQQIHHFLAHFLSSFFFHTRKENPKTFQWTCMAAAEYQNIISCLSGVISFLSLSYCDTHGGTSFFHQTTPGRPLLQPIDIPEPVLVMTSFIPAPLLPFLLASLQPPNENKMTTLYQTEPGRHRKFPLRGRH